MSLLSLRTHDHEYRLYDGVVPVARRARRVLAVEPRQVVALAAAAHAEEEEAQQRGGDAQGCRLFPPYLVAVWGVEPIATATRPPEREGQQQSRSRREVGECLF